MVAWSVETRCVRQTLSTHRPWGPHSNRTCLHSQGASPPCPLPRDAAALSPLLPVIVPEELPDFGPGGGKAGGGPCLQHQATSVLECGDSGRARVRDSEGPSQPSRATTAAVTAPRGECVAPLVFGVTKARKPSGQLRLPRLPSLAGEKTSLQVSAARGTLHRPTSVELRTPYGKGKASEVKQNQRAGHS